MATGTLGPDQLAAVGRLFRTLGDPTRLALLQALRAGPRAVGELVTETEGKQANVSKQLGILFDAGLVARTRDGNVIRYRIADPVVFKLCELVCGKLSRDATRRAKAFAG